MSSALSRTTRMQARRFRPLSREGARAVLAIAWLFCASLLAPHVNAQVTEAGEELVGLGLASKPTARPNVPLPPVLELPDSIAEPPADTAKATTREAEVPSSPGVERSPDPDDPPAPLWPALQENFAKTLPTVTIFALASLVPAAILMVTAYVRISVVLMLLRQALGSPQIPGNQVLTVLSLLLTTMVMEPAARTVYSRGIQPYQEGRLDAEAAWIAGSAPLKVFMIEQIVNTGHQKYLWRLYDQSPKNSGQNEDPKIAEEFPFRVVASAFLLSELTTALLIGFAIYLPFLVIDLVVSSVLAAMGLFLMPPTLVAMPLKLILFVLADGWILVPEMLLRSFETT